MARLITTFAMTILLAGCAAAPYARADFGLEPLEREQFPDLDEALEGLSGHPLMVFAQENLGQFGPVAESQVGFMRFQGALVSAADGWVSLFRAPDDTVRISKGHITGVWRVRPAANDRASALGALLFGLTAFAIMRIERPEDRFEATTQFAVVAGSALLGGSVGKLLFGGPRRGEQLYPLPRPR